MRKYRSVDDAHKWMKTAVNEDTIVQSMASAVVAEIQAQYDHMTEREIEISRLGSLIRDLEKENASLVKELGVTYDILDNMKIMEKVTGILQRQGIMPRF